MQLMDDAREQRIEQWAKEQRDRLTPSQLRTLWAEREVMEGILRAVEKGVRWRRAPISLHPSFKLIAYANGIATAAGTTQNGTEPPTILYTPAITLEMNPYILSGVLAHEVGHFVRGDTEGMEGEDGEGWSSAVHYEHEFGADRFAAEKGFGEALIESFEYAKTLTKRAHWNSAGPQHPGLEERIQRIRAYLAQAVERRAA